MENHYTTLYYTLMYIHLITVIPCVFIGAYLLLFSKGTIWHRNLGKYYMISMMVTAIVSLFMPAMVGPQFLNHFGYIHLFSLLTLWSVPTAYIAIRKGQVKKHKLKMIFLYIGALIIAGGFTFVPGRFMYEVFFG
ncbi:putative membrane protein [Nonlabens xylanidelens]|uniref:Putative membrane protein n=1 Tax=Nonlabens xylanidelens TaxID=191564 RepID=A0A2S6IEV9_9FLAO|nr:DUF2306 domain-containing protein [Nonlabens xylanidelens]PPK92755.1 putative membrane protein [Nonlabens xylanidelens]PQJ19802.1 hypothetical protein BST94_06035 [Nonlabens xylanidelens]